MGWTLALRKGFAGGNVAQYYYDDHLFTGERANIQSGHIPPNLVLKNQSVLPLSLELLFSVARTPCPMLLLPVQFL